jgi:hypothetical protein
MKKILSALFLLVILGSCAGSNKNTLDKITAVEFGTSANEAIRLFKKQGFKPLSFSTEESLEQLSLSRYNSMFQKKPDLFTIHAFSAKLDSSTPSNIFAIFYADQFYTLHVVQKPIDMKAFNKLMVATSQKFGEAEIGSSETLSFWYLDGSLDRFLVIAVQDESSVIMFADETIPMAVDQAHFDALPVIKNWPFAADLGLSTEEVMTLENQTPFERFSSGQDEMISFLANFNGDRLIYSYIFFPNQENEAIARILSINSFEGDLIALETMLNNRLGNPSRIRRNVVSEAYGTDLSATITEWTITGGRGAKMITISYPLTHSHASDELHDDNEPVIIQQESHFVLTDDLEQLALFDF